MPGLDKKCTCKELQAAGQTSTEGGPVSSRKQLTNDIDFTDTAGQVSPHMWSIFPNRSITVLNK